MANLSGGLRLRNTRPKGHARLDFRPRPVRASVGPVYMCVSV